MNETNNADQKKSVAPFIEIEKNCLAAYLILPRPMAGLDLSQASVRELLLDAGVNHGLLDKVLDALDHGLPDDYKLTVAEGRAPVDEVDGHIEYFIDAQKPIKVTVGEKIGEIHPPGNGEDGISVKGEKLLAAQGKNAEIPELGNVLRPDNSAILEAAIEGYLNIDKFEISIRPFFDLIVAKDTLSATATVARRIESNDFGPDELTAFLVHAGITDSILKGQVIRIFDEGLYEQPVRVAHGKEVRHGIDGSIKYYFSTSSKPIEDEHGNVDYKELNLIKNVHTDDKLAEIIPPVPGEEGSTVFGVPSQPKIGVTPLLPIGKNTIPDPANLDILLAAIDGSVKMSGTKVDIDPVYQVRKNVDYTTGNIKVIGSVMVNGDVMSGFKIKAHGDVQINGTVEDAVIESDGNVMVKYGFIGRGKGCITAAGDVHVAFSDNERIVAGGDVIIGSYAMNSDIQSQGTIEATSKQGLISGGECCAVKGINVNIVGGKHSEPTQLYAGVDKVMKTHLKNIDAKINHIETLLKKLLRRRLIKKDMPPKIKELLEQMHQIKKRHEHDKTLLLAEIEKMHEKDDICKKAAITIHETAYAGTGITIFNRQLTVTDSLKALRYRLTGDGVLIKDSLKDGA